MACQSKPTWDTSLLLLSPLLSWRRGRALALECRLRLVPAKAVRVFEGMPSRRR